ncbi:MULTISPECIES: four helix bundle protein [Soonwooa]|uniref:Four helix bundle protein n=1 Tax=Soonwooa buanensis TaxID=619805 RepID=A0A1T5FXM5_9FLAO|nr:MULTISPECIES: four helix bundle protein [Soonwooa]SKC00965.1 four helix bundle protein [Soonwooa buanensis]
MTKNFEEFPVYQKSLDLVQKIFEYVKNDSFKNEFEFVNQIKRAGISVANNIAEGSEYNSNRQFIRFLKISKGSCGEVRNMIFISKKVGLDDENIGDEILVLSKEVSSNLSNFIKYLSQNIEKRNL